MKILKQVLVWSLIVDVALVGVAGTASAGIIDADDAFKKEPATTRSARVDRTLTEAIVIQRLITWGVDPSTATRRVGALTDDEFQELARGIDALPPAAAGLLEVVGITFVVLLILELVGVIDIFKRI